MVHAGPVTPRQSLNFLIALEFSRTIGLPVIRSNRHGYAKSTSRRSLLSFLGLSVLFCPRAMVVTTFHLPIYFRTFINEFRHINPRAVWDRTVLVMFFGCLFLLSHALTGYRLGDHASPMVDQMSTVERIRLGSGETADLWITAPPKEQHGSDQNVATVRFKGSRDPPDYSQTLSPIEFRPKVAGPAESVQSIVVARLSPRLVLYALLRSIQPQLFL